MRFLAAGIPATVLAATLVVSSSGAQNLFDALSEQDESGGSIEEANQAVKVAEEEYGPDSPQVGAALLSAARIHEHQGYYPEAEALYKRALTVNEAALGDKHKEVAECLNCLA